MADSPTVLVIPGQAQNGAPEPNERGTQDENERAERVGQMTAELRRAQEEIAALRMELESGKIDRELIARLESRIAAIELRAMEIEEDIEEEVTDPDLTLVTPEPEPLEPEPAPPPPKKSLIERILSI